MKPIPTSSRGAGICGWVRNQGIPFCSLPPFPERQQWTALVGPSQEYMKVQSLQLQALSLQGAWREEKSSCSEEPGTGDISVPWHFQGSPATSHYLVHKLSKISFNSCLLYREAHAKSPWFSTNYLISRQAFIWLAGISLSPCVTFSQTGEFPSWPGISSTKLTESIENKSFLPLLLPHSQWLCFLINQNCRKHSRWGTTNSWYNTLLFSYLSWIFLIGSYLGS